MDGILECGEGAASRAGDGAGGTRGEKISPAEAMFIAGSTEGGIPECGGETASGAGDGASAWPKKVSLVEAMFLASPRSPKASSKDVARHFLAM